MRPVRAPTGRNLAVPRPLSWAPKAILDVARSIHTVVFGLLLASIDDQKLVDLYRPDAGRNRSTCPASVAQRWEAGREAFS
ncbi:hypothetical protein ACCAA_570013 [Candidatus Accumulibacter aalborgensis]|uniref:Uncharacterized protein n=1 Tax=Candidatus Accumulibacter aalborgensis TaxID=1860102 RepID=A0A1A8XTI4_9PROT|nr:hypothetical protein [Candidatus Accumulibacter aalborgensis]SBT08394.1 hypothetical protein ACCAA_570013 [Candidatus Accumulibacter aalborgensis]